MPGHDLPGLAERLRQLPAVGAPAGLAERIAARGRGRPGPGGTVDRPTPVLGPLLVQDATPAQLAGGRWRALPVLPAGQLEPRDR